MKITIGKTSNTWTLQVAVPHGPDSARIAGMVLRSDNVLFNYAPDGQYWGERETEEALVFDYQVQGLFACSGVLQWANRLPRDIAFILEYDKRQLAGDKSEIKRDKLAPYPVVYVYDDAPVADAKALEAAMKEPDSVHPLGVFALSAQALRVTDPCYEKTSSSAGIVSALQGNWLAETVVGDTDWFRRVKALRIRHDSLPAAVFDNLAAFAEVLNVGVDSGQCGFFDDAFYPEGDPTLESNKTEDHDIEHAVSTDAGKLDSVDELGLTTLDVPDDEDTESAFYADCCQLTLDDALPGGGVLAAGTGAVSRSGFGDGGYAVKVLTNADGQVVAAVLTYLGDEDEEGDSIE
jgi:hypothetical protein